MSEAAHTGTDMARSSEEVMQPFGMGAFPNNSDVKTYIP